MQRESSLANDDKIVHAAESSELPSGTLPRSYPIFLATLNTTPWSELNEAVASRVTTLGRRDSNKRVNIDTHYLCLRLGNFELGHAHHSRESHRCSTASMKFTVAVPHSVFESPTDSMHALVLFC